MLPHQILHQIHPSSPIISANSHNINAYQLYPLWNHGDGKKSSVEVLVGDRHTLALVGVQLGRVNLPGRE